MKYAAFLSIAAILLGLGGQAHAEDAKSLPDIVMLKSGGKLRGTITEQIPGDYVLIQLASGETRRFKSDEVSFAGPEAEAPKPAAPATPSQPAEPAHPAAKSPSPSLTVNTKSEGVMVAEITERSMAQAGNVTAVGVAWKDICAAPCSFELDPGLHEIMIYGDGFPATSKKVDLRQGHKELVAKPGSSGLTFLGSTLFVTGGVAAIIGVTFLLVAKEQTTYNADGSTETTESGTHKLALPLLLGGLGGMTGGVGLMIAGSSSLDEPKGERRAVGSKPTMYGLTYRGAF